MLPVELLKYYFFFGVLVIAVTPNEFFFGVINKNQTQSIVKKASAARLASVYSFEGDFTNS